MPGPNENTGSGIAGLDFVLGGGFPRGQLSLLRGASGAGKTTLSLQFLIEGARSGESVLYVGTSETERDIRRIALSHGWTLEGVVLHHHVAPQVGLDQTMLHPAEVELPQTIESMLALVKQNSPTRLVIDSLTEIRVLARDELWYRRQLMTLKEYFADNRCTVLLTNIDVDERAALDSIVNAVVELEQITPLYGPDRRRLRVAKVRGQDYSTGYHDYRIRTGGLEVFPRLAAAEHRQRFATEQFSTGVPQLDTMLCGGLTRGTSTLLLGPSGTGKSVMATQLLVAAAERGEQCAFFVFDERVQTLFQRAEGIGLALQRHVDEGRIDVRQIDPAELTSGEFSHTAKDLVENHGLRMLIIDSLNGYAYAMPEEDLLSVHLHELISYLSQQAVTSIFTMTQHGLVSELVQQPFDVSYVADAVILFRPFEFAGQVHKAISVYKNRSGPHESSIRELKIGPGGVEVSDVLRQFQGILSGAPQFIGDKLDGQRRDAASTGG
jgi:circadian clock protein KaiC